MCRRKLGTEEERKPHKSKHPPVRAHKAHGSRAADSQTCSSHRPTRGRKPARGAVWPRRGLPEKHAAGTRMAHPGKPSRAGRWQERWNTLGQRSQHSNSPPLRHTAQKSSFSIGTGGPFLAPGVRGMSLCSSGEAPAPSGGCCPAREVTVTFLPPRLGAWMASGRLFWLTLEKKGVSSQSTAPTSCGGRERTD